jgi:hypothetical protein
MNLRYVLKDVFSLCSLQKISSLQLHASLPKELGLFKLDIPNKNNLTSILQSDDIYIRLQTPLTTYSFKSTLETIFFPFMFGNVNKYLTFKNIFINYLG